MTNWATRPPYATFLMFQTQLWHLRFKVQWVFGLCQHIRIKSVAETANQSRPRSRPECWETPLTSQIYRWAPWEDSEDVPGQQTNKTTTTTTAVKYSIHLFTVLIQRSTKPEEEQEDTGWQSLIRSFNKYWPLIKITSNQTAFNRKLQLKKWTLWFLYLHTLC